MQFKIIAILLLTLFSSSLLANNDFYKGVAEYDKNNYSEAAIYFKKAAEQGHAFAQSNLGFMYENGQGVIQDYKQAIPWYRKAAEQGHANAQYNLGLMYAKGQGVTQDNKQAYVWFSISAISGNSDAVKNRDIAEKKLSPENISKARQDATVIFVKISANIK